MKASYVEPAIVQFLAKTDASLFGRFNDLRSTVQGWLQYVPATFPHYTSHGLDHSDEIIRQVSQILFETTDSPCTLPSFSAMEAYIFCCSALLHDAGMVASDKEKLTSLSSSDWSDWLQASADRVTRWENIAVLYREAASTTSARRAFEADLQTRFLLAEYVRRTHHIRAADLLALRESQFTHFAFDDPILLQAIADVCLSHGLSNADLGDRFRFPDRCDIISQPVNLRFVALLLRIGDLLDMSCDRACPLLLNAACPLPADSLAHWTQYRRITRRLTAPDLIEVHASCETQDEHRFLRDWLSWLANEVEQATVLMARARRHKGWIAPLAVLDGPKPTLIVKPSTTATYIPSNWRFELRPELIFERLSRDLYPHPLAFVRELLQNALDASRCKLYQDLQHAGKQTPEYPTEVDLSTRSQYPVTIVLETRILKDELSGGIQSKQFLIVEDFGIGMNEDIVQNYLLQVGRSYYKTNEFKRNFGFVPTSRFGVGFLSLFAVSDNISLETLHASVVAKGIRLHLTGPRNYLLLEKSTRRLPGTRVEVMLKEKLRQNELTESLQEWCVRVEFPVVVKEEHQATEITAQPLSAAHEWPVANSKSKFVTRCFPINRNGIEGQLCLLAQVESNGQERWDRYEWSQHAYLGTHASAVAPVFHNGYLCLQGIRLSSDGRSGFIRQLDLRDDSTEISLSRESVVGRLEDSRVESRWGELFEEHLLASHLAQGETGWKYKQRLAAVCPAPLYWRDLHGSIPLRESDTQASASLNSMLSLRTFRTLTPCGHVDKLLWSKKLLTPLPPTTLITGSVYLTGYDIHLISDWHRDLIFSQFSPTKVEITEGWIVVHWEAGSLGSTTKVGSKPILLASLPSEEVLALNVHKTVNSVYEAVLLNTNHPLAEHLLTQKKVSPTLWSKAIDRIYDAVHFSNVQQLSTFLKEWNDVEGLERPPKVRKLTIDSESKALCCLALP